MSHTRTILVRKDMFFDELNYTNLSKRIALYFLFKISQ